MLLRRISQHVKDQNWFAVALDFVIVVFGVFIGIQVSNWNEQRVVFQQESDALVQLKKELESSIDLTQTKVVAYQQSLDAGKRSLAFLDGQEDCADKCWDRLVDFMHASQWQDLRVSDSSYQNMRNHGFPKDIEIVDAVEVYLAQSTNNGVAVQDLPVYRSIVRQQINIKAQEFYWEHCWSFIDGVEKYILDCPEGLSNTEAKSLIEKIIKNPAIGPQLTEWTGAIVTLPQALVDQNIAARKAIDLITEELKSR